MGNRRLNAAVGAQMLRGTESGEMTQPVAQMLSAGLGDARLSSPGKIAAPV